MAIDKIFSNDSVDGIADNLFNSVSNSVSEVKAMQQRKAAENVQLVIQSLRKIENDLRAEYGDVADKLSVRIAEIKNGQDGRNGSDGRAGKDGRAGRDGIAGAKGADGLPGADGIDGIDGVSVTDASIDFDGSLVITLSNGRVINVGEVVSQELANNIKVISTMSTNGAVGIKDEGTSVSTGVKNINFVGATVTATASGDDVTVNVSAGTGTVTSVAVSGGTTGLTTSGGPITTTGTITLAGTLATANGGTGNATGTATINANLTGDVTSVGNATSIAAGVIVNADINASAAIVDTKLATISTASKVSNSATTATSANTASAIVARDASGNFTAGTITAAVTGTSIAASTVLQMPDGVVAVPGLRVGTSSSTGLFSSGDNTLRVASSGTQVALFTSTGINSTAVGATTPAAGAFTTLSATGLITGSLDQVIGFKNKIIGGDFTVNPWQRGTSFAAIATATYFADRWLNTNTTTAVITASRAVDAPTAAQAGIFTQNCISMAVTTADTAIAAGDLVLIRHFIEGTNAASFGFGQTGSRNVTVSFWVKGTKTGIHCVSITNSAQDRAYVAEYTIVTTNTWEYKNITIPVDTTGTWLYDTGIGLRLSFALMSGTTYQTTANAWAAGALFATANQVNAMDNTSNVFKIALVQLEAGSVATSFDVRSVGTELALCQRYYYRDTPPATGLTVGGNGTCINATQANVNCEFPVPMRDRPTALEQSGTATDYSVGDIGSIACSAVPAFANASVYRSIVTVTVTVGLTLGFAMRFRAANGTAGFLGWSAEL